MLFSRSVTLPTGLHTPQRDSSRLGNDGSSAALSHARLKAWSFFFQNEFCRPDYVVATSTRSHKNSHYLLTMPTSGMVSTTTVGDRKVTRHNLVRFEAHDTHNQQWVMRTFDGEHVAIDYDGNLTVQVL